MSKQSFVVVVDVPEGVTLGEIAGHIAESSRRAARRYGVDDPLHRLAELEVFAAIPAAELAASQPVEVEGNVLRLTA